MWSKGICDLMRVTMGTSSQAHSDFISSFDAKRRLRALNFLGFDGARPSGRALHFKFALHFLN